MVGVVGILPLAPLFTVTRVWNCAAPACKQKHFKNFVGRIQVFLISVLYKSLINLIY